MVHYMVHYIELLVPDEERRARVRALAGVGVLHERARGDAEARGEDLRDGRADGNEVRQERGYCAEESLRLRRGVIRPGRRAPTMRWGLRGSIVREPDNSPLA